MGDHLRGCQPQPDRPFQVLEIVRPMLEDTHLLTDKEDCQLSVKPGYGASDPS